MPNPSSPQVRNGARRAAFGLALSFILSVAAPVQAEEPWTLQSSVERVLAVAPEMRAAESAIAARRGATRQAAAWPNPGIELRADDKVGKDAGTGGTGLTQFVFSQPLPLSGRRGHRRDIAGAELGAAQAERGYQQLLLEVETARRFHGLQLTAAALRLAEQRLRFADELQQVGLRRQQAGELARLEQLRIDLIREAAEQAAANAEGKYGEALSRFRALLALPAEARPEPVPLEPLTPAAPLASWQADLSGHPALVAEKSRLQAARSHVDLARSERLPDPVLRLFREQDFLGGRRQDVTGVGVGLTVPLWDRNDGRIAEARAQAEQARAGIAALERDLDSRLRQSHLHLSHLVEQGEHYRRRVFEPAQMLFELTRKAYAVGEAEILALIDAHNTYFDAEARYLELLQEAWLEAAELRLAAGRALITLPQETQP